MGQPIERRVELLGFIQTEITELTRQHDDTPDWDQHRLRYLDGRLDGLHVIRTFLETRIRSGSVER